MSLILIADGDNERGKRIAEACAARGLACSVASHGASALEKALTESPSVLVCQLDLPLIDGPRLAAILEANPRTHGLGRVFVADRPVEAASEAEGEVVGPPADPDQVAACAQALLAQRPERRTQGPPGEGGVEGQLAQLQLADLLELFHVSRKTGVVELMRRDGRRRRETGRVVLREGDAVHAAVGDVEGVKAFFRLLGWDRGSFSFRPGAAAAPTSIEISTRALLREGQRQLSEWDRVGVELPPLDAHVRLRIERSALPNVIHPLTQEVLLVLEMHGRVGDVVDHCSFPDYQVLRTLHTLIGRGIVELRRDPEAFRRAPEAGLFTPAHVARLREWLSGGRGSPVRDAKLLVVSSHVEATCHFTRLLGLLPDSETDARIAGGTLRPDDIVPIGRLAVDDDLGIELIHVPASQAFAPFWATAGYGALGTLLLLAGPVEPALSVVGAAAAELRRLPRARMFHLLLLEKGQRVTADAIRDHLALLDDGSLFLVPLESEDKTAALLREAFGRILP